MRSFLRKVADKLKLCCCFCIVDSDARLVEESKPIIVEIKKQPGYVTLIEQSRKHESLMFQTPPRKIEPLIPYTLIEQTD